MAPGSYIPYKIGQPTVAGGANTGVMAALQHPDQFKKASEMGRLMHQAYGTPERHPFATNGGFTSTIGGDYGGYGGGSAIHGYSGGGIPTNLFSQLTGRGPTAHDVEQANGGSLGPQHNQMGSLDQFTALQQRMTPWQQLQMAAGAPTTQGHRSPIAASVPLAGMDSRDIPTDTMMAAEGGNISAGQPVIVGERGPELVVPDRHSTVIPNEYLPTMHLLNGDILSFLKHYLHS